MHVHRYEKLWLAASLVLIVGIIATVTYGAVGLGIAMIDDEADNVDPNALSDHDGFGDPGVEQVGENEYEVHVVAQAWSYNPGTIEVPEDSEVTFYVTSRDVTHSFSVVGTNVNTMVIPGEVAEMTVEFDDPAEYGVLCNEYCGEYHHDMEGQLHVVPEDEFDMTSLAVDAPDEVEVGDDAEFTVAVTNDELEDLETTVQFEVGNETIEEDITVPGGETTETTVTIESDDLGEGDHDWSATVGDHVESGSLSVVTDADDGNEGEETDDTETESED